MRRSLLFLSLVLSFRLAGQTAEPVKPAPQPAPGAAPAEKAFGNLRVHVRGPKGAPLPGALVSLEKLERAHETGETGDVSIAWVPVGKHEVKITKAGFKGLVASVTLREEPVGVLDVALEPEGK